MKADKRNTAKINTALQLAADRLRAARQELMGALELTLPGSEARTAIDVWQDRALLLIEETSRPIMHSMCDVDDEADDPSFSHIAVVAMSAGGAREFAIGFLGVAPERIGAVTDAGPPSRPERHKDGARRFHVELKEAGK